MIKRRSFQNRLSMKLEPVKRKVLDELISLTGMATDCIRVKFKRNKDGDPIYDDIEKATVDSIIFPKIPETSFRRLMDLLKEYALVQMLNLYEGI